jgi:hypothetical protein
MYNFILFSIERWLGLVNVYVFIYTYDVYEYLCASCRSWIVPNGTNGYSQLE